MADVLAFTTLPFAVVSSVVMAVVMNYDASVVVVVAV
jgi:hypothetical protein